MKKCPKCGASVENEAKICCNCGNVFPEKRPFSKAGVAGFICSLSAVTIVPTVLISYLFVIVIYDLNDYERFFMLLGAVSCLAAFVCCILGFFFSLNGVKDSRKENLRGQGMASTGLVLSSVLGGICLTWVAILVAQAVLLGALLGTLLNSPSSSGSSSSSSRSSYSDWEYERRLTETTTYTEETWSEETTTEKRTMTYGTGPEKIDLWSFTDEIPKMVGEYIDLHPEFGEKYTVECTIIATDGGAYQRALDNALAAGGDTAPDIYSAEAAFILKYSKGEMSQFASTYKDLGIDVDKKIKEADIAKYSVDIGTFGTDDPSEIEKIVGAGSGNWDKFFKAAEQIKEKGYVAVSGPSDLWNGCEKSADTPWVVDGELKIDPKREKYIDIAKTIADNGYSNGAHQWSEPWYTDMKGEGEHKVFAFFGPMWLIQYVMIGNSGYWPGKGEGTFGQWRVCAPPVGFFWGGTWLLANKDTDQKEGVAELIEWITLDTSETGLQYLWANGLVDWDNDPGTTTSKDTVTSAVVMAKSDGSLDFCGGQNVYPAFIAGNKYASAKAMTQYDEHINGYWTDCVEKYVDGTYSREEAIEEFKKLVMDNITF